MEIREILEFIKNLKEEEIEFSYHSLDRLNKREINQQELIKIVLNNKIVSITEQKDKYLGYFFKTQEKDLAIAFTKKGKHFKIITTYIINSNRRLKK